MARDALPLLCALLLTLAACAGPGQIDPELAEGASNPYRLDSGDELRVVVFDQDGLTNSYTVDDSGRIAMPLIGNVDARGRTTEELAEAVAQRLRGGYLREPSVAVEVESARPFFILGEVGNPGQYSYVPGMTARTAVAIAGGFTPRATRTRLHLTRRHGDEEITASVPLDQPIAPGDTIEVPERWF